MNGASGIRFFGDVHGCAQEFAALAADARARNLHLHSLGDLINRGPDSPACMRLACDLSEAGHLDMNPGNHDERFALWFRGVNVPVKPSGLGSTLTQLQTVSDNDALAERYYGLVMRSRLWSRFGSLYTVHAAFDPKMIGREGPELWSSDWSSKLHGVALEGEIRSDGDPMRRALGRRSFNWVERIPAGVTVMIGHSIASLEGVRERRNKDGGRLLHLDTGLQRGGKLSYIDVPMAEIRGLSKFTAVGFEPVSDQEIIQTRKGMGKSFALAA
jgi:protein phosphatase